jgi:hypothetical protein
VCSSMAIRAWRGTDRTPAALRRCPRRERDGRSRPSTPRRRVGAFLPRSVSSPSMWTVRTITSGRHRRGSGHASSSSDTKRLSIRPVPSSNCRALRRGMGP